MSGHSRSGLSLISMVLKITIYYYLRTHVSMEGFGAIGIDDAYMCLNASKLRCRVSEPVAKKALALIQEQLDGAKDLSAIFVVGGFDASNVVFDHVRLELRQTISAPYKPIKGCCCSRIQD
ncbi:hypothetical protein EDD21DRAFT_437729 [Dissophora ornata]|nr:hypothetical protein EDD21DRAFT_437729 [Dissophora ornata]